MSNVAIVTGGNTGIGRRLALALAEAGFDVAISYVSEEGQAASLVAEAERFGIRAIAVECDAGRKADVSAFYDTVEAWSGRAPSVLVNNAGIQTWSSLLDLEESAWDDVIRTNLKGTFLNTQEAGKRMAAAGKPGSIINIGSGCNKLAFPNLVSYTASKGGIEQLTKSAAVELGPHGIRVNCVAPGAIMNERTALEAPDYAGQWARITPLRRVGAMDDLAGPVLFFASEASAFVTGQTLYVDGGVFTQANWPQTF